MTGLKVDNGQLTDSVLKSNWGPLIHRELGIKLARGL